MQIGTVFTVDGEQFTIKNVEGDRVDASLLKKDDKGVLRPQRGRPRMFDKSIVLKALGEIQEEPQESPPQEVPAETSSNTEENIQHLLNLFDDPEPLS